MKTNLKRKKQRAKSRNCHKDFDFTAFCVLQKPLPAVILRYNPFNVSFLHFICPCHLHSPHSPSLFPLFSDHSSPPPTSIRSLSLQTADHVQWLDMPFMPSGGFRGHGVRRLIVIRHNGLASGFIFIKKGSNFFFFLNALKKEKNCGEIRAPRFTHFASCMHYSFTALSTNSVLKYSV